MPFHIPLQISEIENCQVISIQAIELRTRFSFHFLKERVHNNFSHIVSKKSISIYGIKGKYSLPHKWGASIIRVKHEKCRDKENTCLKLCSLHQLARSM